jgi:prepilin-type N-terminal cleavage/methylation domain-containing protein
MSGVLRDSHGFSLVELLVAIVVSTVLMAAIFQILVSSQRIYTVQSEQILGQQTIRSGTELLASELREVSPGQGDLLTMEPDRVRFQGSRAFGIACEVVGEAPLELIVEPAGSAAFEADEEVVLFVEGNPSVASDDAWVRGVVEEASTGVLCPGDRPAQRVVVGSLSFTPPLGAVRRGASIRSLETLNYGRIGEGGDAYLGRITEDGAEVPLVGPVAGDRGITFRYLDAVGNETTQGSEVRTIELTVRTASDARRQDGETLADSMTIAVHTRN